MVSEFDAKLLLRYERPRKLFILHKNLFVLMQYLIYLCPISTQLSRDSSCFQSRSFAENSLYSF